MTDTTKQAVNRFLGWKLPNDFRPDAGIEFSPSLLQLNSVHGWPTGTNLFTADQARAMFEYCLQDTRADLVKPIQAEPVAWQPIATAPRNNKRFLYLARLNDDGTIQELDYDGSWESDSESWEIPEVYYFWASAHGIEEPTHWAYQDTPPPLYSAVNVLTDELKAELLEALRIGLFYGEEREGTGCADRKDKMIRYHTDKIRAAITKLTNLECGS